jgi:outer membrane protein insertion porin family
MKALDRCCRPLCHLAVVLLAGAAAPCFAQTPAKPIVGDVIVPPGNYHLPISRLYGLIKTRPGSAYDPDIIDQDIRALYETRGFSSVQVKKTDPDDDGKVIAYFSLTPLFSTVHEIIYEGAKHLSNDDLETATSLRKGQPLNPITNLAACHHIEKLYADKARMFAKVELLEGDKPGDPRVYFRITEGPKAKVRSTHFSGSHFASEARLRTQVNTWHAFMHFLEGDYSPAMANKDVAVLEKYYKSFGFQDVVVSRDLQWSEDHRFVDIIFHINEGSRYRLASTDGYKTLDEDKLLRLIPAKPGEYYNQNIVQAGSTNIKDFTGYDGGDALVKEDLTFSPSAAPGEVPVRDQTTKRQQQKVVLQFDVHCTKSCPLFRLEKVQVFPRCD